MIVGIEFCFFVNFLICVVFFLIWFFWMLLDCCCCVEFIMVYYENYDDEMDLLEIRWKMLVVCDICRWRKVCCDGWRLCLRCSKGSKVCIFVILWVWFDKYMKWYEIFFDVLYRRWVLVYFKFWIGYVLIWWFCD